MPCRRSARRRLAACLALVLGGTACEYDRTIIAQGVPRLAVHAVPNPASPHVIVLVEYVLSGRAPVRHFQSFDPLDPIVSGGREPGRGTSASSG